MAAYPTLVSIFRFRFLCSLMNRWVVDSNNLAIDLQRVGNPYPILSKHARQGLRGGGFSNARRTIEEDPRPGVDCCSELRQGFAIHYQMREGRLDIILVNPHVADALFPNLLNIARQSDGRSSRIVALG